MLQGVNLTVERGSSMVIIGGSGTGKSVLLKTVIGLVAPDSGRIFVDGQDIRKKEPKQLSKALWHVISGRRLIRFNASMAECCLSFAKWSVETDQ